MRFDIITIFPEIISDYSRISLIARARLKKLIKIHAHNLKDFASDVHRTVDDRPYGGGAGMVLKADILYKAIAKISKHKATQKVAKSTRQRIILLTPQGQTFNQSQAERLAKYDQLIFVSGRYEGFDERVRSMVDEEFSIGDYILMGGELAALVMIEAISRLIPGVIGKNESTLNESFSKSSVLKSISSMAHSQSAVKSARILEYPQYTRPEILKFKGLKQQFAGALLKVPGILLSGNHQKIEQWRNTEALKRTKKRRPDLLKK